MTTFNVSIVLFKERLVIFSLWHSLVLVRLAGCLVNHLLIDSLAIVLYFAWYTSTTFVTSRAFCEEGLVLFHTVLMLLSLIVQLLSPVLNVKLFTFCFCLSFTTLVIFICEYKWLIGSSYYQIASSTFIDAFLFFAFFVYFCHKFLRKLRFCNFLNFLHLSSSHCFFVA